VFAERRSGAHGHVRGQHAGVLGEARAAALQHRSAPCHRPSLRAARAMPTSLAAAALPRPETLQLLPLLQRQRRSSLAGRTPPVRHEEDHAAHGRMSPRPRPDQISGSGVTAACLSNKTWFKFILLFIYLFIHSFIFIIIIILYTLNSKDLLFNFSFIYLYFIHFIYFYFWFLFTFDFIQLEAQG